MEKWAENEREGEGLREGGKERGAGGKGGGGGRSSILGAQRSETAGVKEFAEPSAHPPQPPHLPDLLPRLCSATQVKLHGRLGLLRPIVSTVRA